MVIHGAPRYGKPGSEGWGRRILFVRTVSALWEVAIIICLLINRDQAQQALVLPPRPTLCNTLATSPSRQTDQILDTVRIVSTLQSRARSVPPQLRVSTSSPSLCPPPLGGWTKSHENAVREAPIWQILSEVSTVSPNASLCPSSRPYHADGPRSCQDPRKAAGNKDIKSGGQSLLTGK